jgi:hypothetical protein
MVWGGISIDGRMDLVVVHGNLTAVGYIEQILLQHVLIAAYGVSLNLYSCTTMSGLITRTIL